jgi:hypothetical protein
MRFSLFLGACVSTLAIGAMTGPAAAHDIPGSTPFTITLPSDVFTGEVLFITYIGPPVGQGVWHADADFTWISLPGGTPASNISVSVEVAVDGAFQEWTVTGSDLGWTSGPGTFSGQADTDSLNGLVTASGPMGGSIMHVFIAQSNGDGITGGHFADSTITLTLAPIPAPSALAIFALAGASGHRRRRLVQTDVC